MLGIVKEGLAIKAKQPVFLVRGVGGCATAIAELIGLVDRWAGSCGSWVGRGRLESRTAADLQNEVTLDENRQLASTLHVDQAITLAMRRLRRDQKGAVQYK